MCRVSLPTSCKMQPIDLEPKEESPGVNPAFPSGYILLSKGCIFASLLEFGFPIGAIGIKINRSNSIHCLHFELACVASQCSLREYLHVCVYLKHHQSQTC